jgi:hypothetical protein
MTSYDYGSVMHYQRDAFTANGQQTIIPTRNASAIIGQRVGMSEIDILEVQRYYGCVPTPTTTPGSSTTTSRGSATVTSSAVDDTITSTQLTLMLMVCCVLHYLHNYPVKNFHL